MSDDRPDARATVTALTVGTVVSVALLAAAFLLRLAGQTPFADSIGPVAVVALLATPVIGLVATAVELRRVQRTAAILAVVVLGVLMVATALAQLTSR